MCYVTFVRVLQNRMRKSLFLFAKATCRISFFMRYGAKGEARKTEKKMLSTSRNFLIDSNIKLWLETALGDQVRFQGCVFSRVTQLLSVFSTVSKLFCVFLRVRHRAPSRLGVWFFNFRLSSPEIPGYLRYSEGSSREVT